jgi:hypothetical protein
MPRDWVRGERIRLSPGASLDDNKGRKGDYRTQSGEQIMMKNLKATVRQWI